MTKRILALLVALALVFSLVPAVFAETEGEGTANDTTVTEPEATTATNVEVVLQKAHNQTEGKLNVDVFLKADAEITVTGFEFEVATADDVVVTDGEDQTGNDNLAANENKFVYPPFAGDKNAITVGTDRVLVATIELSGGEMPQLTKVTVVTADGFYSDDATDAKITNEAGEEADNEDYLGTVTKSVVSYGCTDHECGHGTGEWTEFALPELTVTNNGNDRQYKLEAGKYYLTGDVQLDGIMTLATSANVTICLNGYDIIGKAGFRNFALTRTNCTLNICDCTATGTGVDYQSGSIKYNANWGGCFRIDQNVNGTINIYGGTFDATDTTQTNFSGSFAYAIGTATFNMYGGKVVNARGNNGAGAIILRGCNYGEVTSVIKDVTFVGCANGMITADSGGSGDAKNKKHSNTLTIEDVVVIDSKNIGSVPTHAVDAKDGDFKTLTIKGNTRFDAPIYVNEANGDVVTLDLGANASLTLETVKDLDEAGINKILVMAEGKTLPETATVMYGNTGHKIAYVDGAFKLVSAHVHEAETYENGTAAGHTVDQIGFQLWTDPTSLPTSGNWALGTDVTLPADQADNIVISAGKTLNLDLNGKTITLANGKRFYVQGTMNLFDCQSGYTGEGEDAVWTGGIITGGTQHVSSTSKLTGGAFSVRYASAVGAEPGTLNIYGGRISGNGNTEAGTSGGAIYVSTVSGDATAGYKRGGELNMYGGELYNNQIGQYGAAVTVWCSDTLKSATDIPDTHYATFNMHGGKIHGNVANNGADVSTTCEGIIYVRENAVFNMTGGEITNNTSENRGTVTTCGFVNISGGAITNNSANNGGAFVMMGGTMNVTGCKLEGNSSVGYGGMMYTTKGTVNFNGVTIKNNTANASSGGFIYAKGSSNTSQVTINVTNCNITGNTAGGLGSAMRLSSNVKLKLEDTTITGNALTKNESSSTHGAVYIEASIPIDLVGKVVIADNTAPNQSDASKNFTQARNLLIQSNVNPSIYVNELAEGSKIEVYNWAKDETAASIFKNRSGKEPTAWNNNWINYYAGVNGTDKAATTYATATKQTVGYVDGAYTFVTGHVHTINGRQVTFTEVTSLPNATELASYTPNEDGTYYFCLTKNVSRSSQLTISANMTVCLNGYDLRGTNEASTRFLRLADPNVTLTIDDCTAYTDAAGVYHAGGITLTKAVSSATYGALLRIENGHFVMNQGRIHDINVTTASDKDPSGFLIYVSDKTNNVAVEGSITFNGGEFNNVNLTVEKSGSCYGPFIYQKGANVALNMSNFAMRNCSVTLNHASQVSDMTGFIRLENASPISINNVVFENNAATVTATNVTYTGSTSPTPAADLQGIVFLNASGTTLQMNNTKFIGNTFTNNSVATKGTSTTKGSIQGLVYARTGTTITGANNEFSGAVMTGKDVKGTAIYSAGTVNLTNTKFIDNQVVGSGAGALYVAGGTATLNGGEFTGNTSPTSGGGVYLGGATLNVTNVKFEDNYAASHGGAIYTGSSSGKAYITNCDFINNSAGLTGGGACLNFITTATVKGGKFVGNTAQNRGGGLYLGSANEAATTVTVGGPNAEDKVVFDGNKVYGGVDDKGIPNNGYGGGLFSGVYANYGLSAADQKGNSTFTYQNLEFKNNEAVNGGGMYVRGIDETVTHTIKNSTFTDNYGYHTSGIMAQGTCVVSIEDTTVTGNNSYDYGAVHAATDSVQFSMSGVMVIDDNTVNSTAFPFNSTEECNLFFQKGEGTYADVDLTGLSDGSRIGVFTQDSRCQAQPIFTTGGSAAKKAYLTSDCPELYILTETEGELALAKHVGADGTVYGTIQAALEAAEAAGETTFTLQTHAKGSPNYLTVTTMEELNLNGFDATKVTVADGHELKLADSANDNFNAEACGVIGTVVGKIATLNETTSATGATRRYVAIQTDAGTSAHRIYVAANKRILRPVSNGLGFGAIYAADEVAAKAITGFGVQLTGNDNFDEFAIGEVAGSEFVAGAATSTPNQKYVIVTNVITAQDNSSRLNKQLNARPYIICNNELIVGSATNAVMQTMIENALASGNDVVVASVEAMLTECGLMTAEQN